MWAFIPNHIHCESVSINITYADHGIIKTEVFGKDDVMVTLSLANESSYNVRVIPYLPFVFLESASIQLRVPYNTPYNVSVLSIDLCGQNSVFEIYYGELKNFMLVES